MGIWIEYSCENRTEASAEGPGLKIGDQCLSRANSGPMEMAEDTQASVIETLRFLDDDARSSGWVKTRSGWYCPYCAGKLGIKS